MPSKPLGWERKTNCSEVFFYAAHIQKNQYVFLWVVDNHRFFSRRGSIEFFTRYVFLVKKTILNSRDFESIHNQENVFGNFSKLLLKKASKVWIALRDDEMFHRLIKKLTESWLIYLTNDFHWYFSDENPTDASKYHRIKLLSTKWLFTSIKTMFC